MFRALSVALVLAGCSSPATSRQPAAVEAGDVVAGDVQAGDVAAGPVQAGTVVAGDVQAGDVAAGLVQAGTVVAGDVQAGDVVAGDLVLPLPQLAGDVAALQLLYVPPSGDPVGAWSDVVGQACPGGVPRNLWPVWAGTANQVGILVAVDCP